MDLIKSGVPGLDEILYGGIKNGSSILIGGVPGVGKTILTLQFLAEGMKSNENGLLVSTEETREQILDYVSALGINEKRFIEKIELMSISITSKIVTLGSIMDVIKKKSIKRVVLDSLTLFKAMNDSKDLEFRKSVYDFIRTMKSLNVIFIATSEREIGYVENMEYRAEDFLFDALIFLFKIRRGSDYERCITVAKIRGQKHMTGIYPFSLSEKGVAIYTKQIPFALVGKQND